MTKKMQIFAAVLTAVLFCGVTLAQNPTVTVDKKGHPNLAQAQEHIVQANHFLELAQKVNNYDMQGHAEKARQLLQQANDEVRAAAEAAIAAGAKAKQGKH